MRKLRLDSLPSAGMLAVGVATVFAAVASWGVQVFASHELGPKGFADFMVVWGLFFAIVGCLQGVQQEATRAVTAVRSGAPAGASVWAGPVALGLAGATVLVGIGLPGLHATFGGDAPSVLLPMALGVVGYAVLNALGGALAGAGRWRQYAALIGSEAAIRSTLLIGVLSWSASLSLVAGALAAGALAVVALAPWASFRRAFRERVDGPVRQFLLRSGQALVATGSTSLVLAGFPFLLELTSDGPLLSEAGVLIAGVVATRAPLLLTMTAYQAAMIQRLTDAGARLRSSTLRIALQVVLATAILACAGSVAGPWALSVVYGQEFRASAPVIVLLVWAAGLTGLLFVTGAACLALRRHALFALGWLLNLTVTVASLAAFRTTEGRVLAALFLGPLVGLVIHALALTRAGPEAGTGLLRRDDSVIGTIRP